MPEALIKPLDYPGSQLICPHQTIRSFIPFTKFGETEIEYYLFPEETKLKGFKLRESETVIDEKEMKLKLLNENIGKQRDEWAANLPSLI